MPVLFPALDVHLVIQRVYTLCDARGFSFKGEAEAFLTKKNLGLSNSTFSLRPKEQSKNRKKKKKVNKQVKKVDLSQQGNGLS